MKPFLSGRSREELALWAESRGLPKFRAAQITQWLYDKEVLSPDDMANIPRELRAALKEDFFAPGSKVSEIVSSPDGVEKLAITLHDGECIEMVIIPADERITFCLSTQVGCPVGCIFCASGKNGLSRNLKAGEMLEQFSFGCARAGHPDNLVFMGIGEGLLNFEELSAALDALTSPEKFGMSPRRITVSTSGYIPGMKKFAQLKKEYNLAVSLHAVDDETRAKLIPPALRYPVAEILAAADMCRDNNNRHYTLEYTLVSGINDSPDAAKKLGETAVRHHAKINLIPCNDTGSITRRPPRDVIENFEKIVAATGARVTRRVERGNKETAACGQLRIRRINDKKEGKI